MLNDPKHFSSYSKEVGEYPVILIRLLSKLIQDGSFFILLYFANMAIESSESIS